MKNKCENLVHEFDDISNKRLEKGLTFHAISIKKIQFLCNGSSE
jgi:hypothetical protein